MHPQGLFAFDIDRTLTNEHHLIPDLVVFRLAALYQEGWAIAFITGRSFSHALMALEKIPFPYTLAAQHGADIIEMPSRRRIAKNYLDRTILSFMETMSHRHGHPFLLHSGFEEGDFCYYKPQALEAKLKSYMDRIQRGSPYVWKDCACWTSVEIDSFPMACSFGSFEEVNKVYQELKPLGHYHSVMILDDREEGVHLLMTTQSNVSKGDALAMIYHHLGLNGPKVAAGDEENDRSMFERADYRIVMGSAPDHLKKLASVVAPTSYELGIIPAIDQVLEYVLQDYPSLRS